MAKAASERHGQWGKKVAEGSRRRKVNAIILATFHDLQYFSLKYLIVFLIVLSISTRSIVNIYL